MYPMFSFINLSPAFNGLEGWLWVTELYCIDPNAKRFKAVEEHIRFDGSVFVYAVPKYI